MNQSDHYWSFQISNHNCRCVGEDFVQQRSALARNYRTGSLQRLDRIDCSSITHDPSDYSVLKNNNSNNQPRFKPTQALCPLHLCPDGAQAGKSTETFEDYEKKSILKQTRQELPKYQPLLPCNINGSLNRAHKVKLSEEFPKYCPRYKNTLTAAPLQSSLKYKYSSQPSLSSRKSNLDIKKHFPSNEEMQKVTKEPEKSNKENLHESQTKNNLEIAKNQPKIKNLSPLIGDKRAKILNEIQTEPTGDLSKSRKPKMFSRDIYTPISRTTRRMLHQEKKIPFVTFGCNNDNEIVGSKRTHNVLASQQEVYPSALSAKMQRQNMIMKFLKSEKEFQKNLLPDDLRKVSENFSLRFLLLACFMGDFRP